MEAGTIYQVCQGTGVVQRAPQALECCWGSPIQLEVSPHAGCGRLRQLLAARVPLLSQRPARQHEEGSIQGPSPGDSLSARVR